jgi:TetR/AcrR family transcriptional regulator, transcriptional repressor for nem operon
MNLPAEPSETRPPIPERKQRLLGAAVSLMLRQGFAATTVGQICAEAGVTKGSFFHYFASKEEICRAAMDAWAGGWRDILTAAGLDRIADPLARLERLFDVMEETYLRPEVPPGCLIGTVAQEVGASNPDLGAPCAAHFAVWTDGVRALLAEAKAAHPPRISFDPDSVADLMLGIVQGTLLVAKTRQDRAIIVNNVRHCRNYVLGLFQNEG